jgi:hypothetical protein
LYLAFCLTAPAQTAAVEGTVTNSSTGAAVPRVHVILQDASNPAGTRYGALTTESGTFSIEGIRPGTYSVTSTRLGFVMPRGSRLAVTLRADDKNSDLRLQLTPTAPFPGVSRTREENRWKAPP